MLSGLQFVTPTPQAAVSPARTDIACFIGFVARRRAVPLPDWLLSQLRQAGWLDGPWRHTASAGHPEWDDLRQVPVAFDSWQGFSQVFDWASRPIQAGGSALCSSYLGAAVRSFFAAGGRRAWVIRVDDPFPYLEAGAGRVSQRSARLDELLPDAASGHALDPADPRSWRGIQHLCGLPEVSLLCLPDLADICALGPSPAPVTITAPTTAEVFVECSEAVSADSDQGLRQLAAPRSDGDGYLAWRRALVQVRNFLGGRRDATGRSVGGAARNDVIFLGALPLPQADASHDDGSGLVHAEADLLAFLRRTGVLESDQQSLAGPDCPASAFIQLAWPWLRTLRSDDLPEYLEPADGLLAGLLARNALERGTFRSVGGSLLPDVVGVTPLPAMGLGVDSPSAQLAQRICLVAPEPDGLTLLSDVTSASDPAWRFGGTSRLMAAILRAARSFGDSHTFEANGPALWARLQRSLESLLAGFWREGAFAGATPNEAFQVRCDRSTMSQSDLDNGRLVAEITVLPAAAIARISVVLDQTAGAPARLALREVA